MYHEMMTTIIWPLADPRLPPPATSTSDQSDRSLFPLPLTSMLLTRPLWRAPALATAILTSRSMSTAPTTPASPRSGPSYPTKPYVPQHTAWPYKPHDFDRADPTPDDRFYVPTRLVTHIDDHAIARLREYYDTVLPATGRIIDLCSSWVSHFPPSLERAARGGGLEVVGMGMNVAELGYNPILSTRVVHDLNEDPELPPSVLDVGKTTATVPGGERAKFDAATCVVSIDYLTKPVEVLKSLRTHLAPGATVHLVISNRCFPTKAINRWLGIDEDARLQMVGDYLWFAGYGEIEIVELSGGWLSAAEAEVRGVGLGMVGRTFGARVDPLWVVRGRNVPQETKAPG